MAIAVTFCKGHHCGNKKPGMAAPNPGFRDLIPYKRPMHPR